MSNQSANTAARPSDAHPECGVCAGEMDTDRSDQYRALRTRIEQGEVEV